MENASWNNMSYFLLVLQKSQLLFLNLLGRTNIPSDKVGDNASKMADLHSKYLQTFLEAEQYKLQVLMRLIGIPEPYKKILWYLYVDDIRFNDIPSMIGYSPSQTKRLLKKGLHEFEKMDLNDTK